MQSSGRGRGGDFGGFSVTDLGSSSPSFFFFFFRFFAFLHSCGNEEFLLGPNRRENLNTFPGLNSGKSSVTVRPSEVLGKFSCFEGSENKNISYLNILLKYQ